MPTNKRIFYATQGVKLEPVDKDGNPSGTEYAAAGIQSVGVTTNFNLEKVFQLGQLSLYESIENNPEVEITLNKVFDGTLPLYFMCMGGGNTTSGDLITFQNNRVNLVLNVHQDTSQGTKDGAASGVSKMRATGLYASSFTFTFPTDGNATEEVTLIGNNKTWESGADTVFAQDYKSKGVARRWKFSTPPNPVSIPSGSPLTNVTVSFDLGREAIYTLGSFEPYLRFVNFPVEITTEITSLGLDGDFLNINENLYSCTGTGSLVDNTIKFTICASGSSNTCTISLGDKNKLSSVNYSGGDTGGGNVEISYSFTTDNDFAMAVAGTYATSLEGGSS